MSMLKELSITGPARSVFQVQSGDSVKRNTLSVKENLQETLNLTRPRTEITTITRKPTKKCFITITEGRGVAIEIGICLFDINSCECILSQFADTPTFTRTLQKISLCDPQKILMNSSSKEITSTESSKLCQLIEQCYSTIPVVTLPRKYFNDHTGIEYIKNYGLQEDIPGLLMGICPKYYCLAATSGSFHYVLENEDFTFAKNTIKFSYHGAEGTIMIDFTTARNLELVINTTNTRAENTLLNILDKTVTSMGKRLLRMNILQPSCCLEIITDRLDAVQKLSESEEGLFNIQSCLKALVDLDHTIAFVVKVPKTDRKVNGRQTLAVQYSESKINHAIGLKQAVKSIQTIAPHLPSSECILIKTIYKILSDPAFSKARNNSIIEEFEKAINNVINEDVGIQKTSLGIRNQKCYAVKVGVNGLLDVARQVYKEAIEDIYDLVTEYSETTELNMKLQFSSSSGFFIQMSISDISENQTLPEKFINILQKNSRINESLAEVYLMSESVVSELLQLFRENINFLYKASEAVALLDMLTSFAISKLSYNYSRPNFTDTLAIKSGRHPILDQILAFPLVPNDTFISLSSSFQLITGPNMSGKSTYLRQVALLNIMAHIGSFIPAEYGSFRLCDQILSRLANDNVFSDVGTSSFMTEMKETAYLLHSLTDSSLVIIDELCRSTSPTDALGIAAAISEELIRSKAFCLFATHLHELTRTLVIYPNVVNLQFKVDVKVVNSDCLVDYQYKIEDGNLTTENHYGLQTAQLLGLPKQLLDAAYEIVKDLKKGKTNFYTNEKVKEITKERKLLWFADKMLQLDQSDLSDDQLLEQAALLQDGMMKES
ncbi:unnamed protein product [Rhizopus stolonifer]